MTTSSWVLDSRVQEERRARIEASRAAAREAATKASKHALDRAMTGSAKPSRGR